MPVLNRIADLAPTVAEWRRDIHAHPEVLFDTHRTSALVAERLRGFGCDEVVPASAAPGSSGRSAAATGSGRVVGRRADMDALPMTEATGLRTPRHPGRDARLRPRRPHRDAARRRAVPRRDPAVRRHRRGDLPAGRGRRRRRPRDGRGRADGALRHPGGLRPAQHAGPAVGDFAVRPARCSPPPTRSPSR